MAAHSPNGVQKPERVLNWATDYPLTRPVHRPLGGVDRSEVSVKPPMVDRWGIAVASTPNPEEKYEQRTEPHDPSEAAVGQQVITRRVYELLGRPSVAAVAHPESGS